MESEKFMQYEKAREEYIKNIEILIPGIQYCSSAGVSEIFNRTGIIEINKYINSLINAGNIMKFESGRLMYNDIDITKEREIVIGICLYKVLQEIHVKKEHGKYGLISQTIAKFSNEICTIFGINKELIN